jgi:hypothetical protein
MTTSGRVRLNAKALRLICFIAPSLPLMPSQTFIGRKLA